MSEAAGNRPGRSALEMHWLVSCTRTRLLACALALTPGLAGAQSGERTAPAAPPAAEQALPPAQLEPWLQARDRDFFGMPAAASMGPTRPLDPALQAFGDEMATVLKRRLREAVPRWLALPAGEEPAFDRLWAQLLQAWGGLQIEMMEPSLGPAWLAALSDPRLCAQPREPSWWHTQLMLVQAVPAAKRGPVLEALRRAVQAFAEPAGALEPSHWPPRPAVGLGELARSWRERLRRDGAADAVAMSPRAAITLLRDTDNDPDLWRWDDRCVLAQAWVQQALAAGAVAPQDATAQFLFATMLEVGDLMRREPSVVGYATLARRLGVEASITVEWTLDAQGRATEPRILKRQMRVPGLPAPRALAYEPLFDASVSAWVRARPPNPGGTSPQRTTLEFKLD